MKKKRKANVFNIDYEYELYDLFEGNDGLKNKIEKIRQELEYIYFFLEANETHLKTNKVYCPHYIEYLKSLGLIIPKMTNESTYELSNWWGELKDIPLEKLLNSKKTSTLFALEENLCHPKTQLIENIDELKKFNPTDSIGEWIARASNSTAGNGILVLKSEEFFSNDKKINNRKPIDKLRMELFTVFFDFFSYF